MKSLRSLIALFSLVVVFAAGSLSQSNPPPFRYQLPWATGFSSPLLLTHAGDGTRRVFVVQRGGIIRVAPPGSTTFTDFMNITSRVLSGGERGLLGLAFHPNFANNGYFFVNYTRQTDGATVVSRFKAINNNSIGDPNSERPLLTIPQPFSNHNGGMIGFREDAPGQHNLYIGMGDGGSGNDPGNRSQNINDLHGKFLRITPNVTDENPSPAYTNPPDNPYVGIAGADEIYAVGVRNPWRWSFDRGGDRALWAGDVGQNNIEEVSIIGLGGNYGWRVYEGTSCTNLDPSLCVPTNYDMPLFQYTHTGGRCSITGGYVYRGVQNALLKGEYIYADYCTGEIFFWTLSNQQTMVLDTSRNIASFGEDEDGELYVVGLGGTIDRILPNKTSADFDGDLRTDVGVFRPETGIWYRLGSRTGNVAIDQFGTAGDIPVAKDYDGDFLSDLAVFRPSEGTWYVLRSTDNTFFGAQFGAEGDVPLAGDYDADGLADFTVYRPSNGVWYTYRTRDQGVSITQFGAAGDVPVPGDYDGDNRYDIAVWRPSNGFWYRLNSTNGAFVALPFGQEGDVPVRGDFDGDLRNDLAVFRPSNGVWYILRSSNGSVQFVQWGVSGDKPVVGDYDGDFIDDIAVYRPSEGVWYIRRSTNGTMQAVAFGIESDIPVPSIDAP